MRYLAIYRPESGEEGGTPTPEHMAAMGELVETMTASGALICTEPLGVRALGARVRLAGGAFEVAEETQRAGGFALLQAGSREEMIAQVKEFLTIAGDGTCEVRQILEFALEPA